MRLPWKKEEKSSVYSLLIYLDAFSLQENFITPSWIYRFRHHITNAPLVMLDANLPPESLKAACISKLFHLEFCMINIVCSKNFSIHSLLMMTSKVMIES